MAASTSTIVQLAPQGTEIVRISFVSAFSALSRASRSCQGTEIVRISFVSRTGRENKISVVQLPGAGYRMPLATMVNLWDIYGHMKGRTYPTIEAFLDDAAEGWKT
jgi:hypothetical protein